MEAVGIVDEIAGMDFEELGEQEAARVGEVLTLAAFELGEIRLTDGFTEL